MATQKPIVLVSGQLQQLPASDQLEPAALGSGTPSDLKFLRGDGAWASPLVGPPPDGTAAKGNARGAGAVDLQYVRSAATQVASGTNSVLSGGSGNTASATASAVGGGVSGVASGQSATVAGGDSCTASGFGSYAAGGNNVASGDYSFVAGGRHGNTRSSYSASAHGAGIFSTNGDAQTKVHVLRRSFTGAVSAQPLLANGGTNDANNNISLPNDSTYLFEANVVARRTDADNESAGWIIRGVVDRNASAATIALVGTPTVTEVARDAALNASVTVDVDTTFGALRIIATVTDSGKTVRFVARVTTVEVVG